MTPSTTRSGETPIVSRNTPDIVSSAKATPLCASLLVLLRERPNVLYHTKYLQRVKIVGWMRFASQPGTFRLDLAELSDNNNMKLEVETYSGSRADERPVRFRIEGRPYAVEDVLDRWYEPDATYFKVRADDGNLYILRQQTSTPEGAWELVSFRQDNRGAER